MTTEQPKIAESPSDTLRTFKPDANLTFKDLTFATTLNDGTKRTILEPCSGHFEAGQMVAIMGPSGSGKSTLLDMLAMKKTAPYSGEVLVNGHPRDKVLFRRIAAYVGQDECMPEHWKVREALFFNANLKRRATSGRKVIHDYIDALMEDFGLTEVANTYIGGPQVRGISGGQRRRVALARGVAAQASIIFADEPTSGLSATDAEACVKALKIIAQKQGVLILVNIHQPRREVAAAFDTLLLLTSSPGRMVYLGPMQDTSSYFAQVGYPVPEYANPTDIYLDMVTPGSEMDAADKLVEAFNDRLVPQIDRTVGEALSQKGQTARQMLLSAHQQAAGDKGPSARVKAFAVPFHVQLHTLLARKIRLTFRNPAAIGMQLAMPAVMGVVLGTVFQGIGTHDFGIPTIQFIFILLTMLSLQSLPLMPVLIEERKYMKEETSEKLYKEGAHIITSMLVTVPLSLMGATIQTLIIFSFAQLPHEFWPVVLGWTLLLFFMFDALFQCVAAIAPDGEQALTMATPFLVVFMLFNGVVVTKATAPAFLKWVFQISPTCYALQAISIKMTHDEPNGYIMNLGYQSGEDFKGVCIVVAMGVVLRLVQVVALKYLNNIQR